MGLVKVYKSLIRLQILHPSSDVYVRSFLCPFSYFNKTLLHKSSWVIKAVSLSQSEIFFRDHESNIVLHKASLPKSTCTFSAILINISKSLDHSGIT